MSEGTTKPNGSREMEVKKDVESQEIEKKIKDAGYDYVMNALEAHFSQDKIQEDENNSGTSGDAKPTKAGDHTLVSNKATIAFKPLIPFIAAGAKAKLKGNKAKDSNKKEAKEAREEKGRDE